MTKGKVASFFSGAPINSRKSYPSEIEVKLVAQEYPARLSVFPITLKEWEADEGHVKVMTKVQQIGIWLDMGGPAWMSAS